MNKNDWADNLPVAITVCDLEGTITYMNDKSRVTFIRDNEDDLVGKNLKDCHSPESNTKIFQLINTQQSNFYTIEKNGKKKMIAQVPWYLGNEVAGLVEFSFEIPLELPHFIRG